MGIKAKATNERGDLMTIYWAACSGSLGSNEPPGHRKQSGQTRDKMSPKNALENAIDCKQASYDDAQQVRTILR